MISVKINSPLTLLVLAIFVSTIGIAGIQPDSSLQPSAYASNKATPYQSHTTKKSSARHYHPKYNTASGTQRDSHGKLKRSSSARHEFMKETGYPHGRPGYVIDHIVPLSKGGADDPSNMQWQTKADAKAKDKWERGQQPKAKHSKKRKG